MNRDFFGLIFVLLLIGGFTLIYPSIRYEPPEAILPQPTSDEAARHLAEAQASRPDPTSVASPER